LVLSLEKLDGCISLGSVPRLESTPEEVAVTNTYIFFIIQAMEKRFQHQIKNVGSVGFLLEAN
jgi:hypothetical protein